MDSKRWKGETVVVVASGPSLTSEDCALIEARGLPTIAVNSSWRMAPFAEVIYAGDAVFWDAYGGEINIPAERWTCSRQAAAKHRIKYHATVGSFNSGMRAVKFVIECGARRIILLGFDCSLKNGIHWHGPHEKTGNPDAAKIKRWRQQFKQVAMLAKARRIEIINCSRHTELTCFPVRDLESMLESVNRDLAVAGQSAV